ncbi:hypothetical protein DITRI_Ditri13aG0128400 [Diplodiscus trichospermus]
MQNDNAIQGVKASRFGPRVNHLCFADNSLLFAKATESESKRMKDMLQNYEDLLGSKN